MSSKQMTHTLLPGTPAGMALGMTGVTLGAPLALRFASFCRGLHCFLWPPTAQ